jgi:hypothetical protein
MRAKAPSTTFTTTLSEITNRTCTRPRDHERVRHRAVALHMPLVLGVPGGQGLCLLLELGVGLICICLGVWLDRGISKHPSCSGVSPITCDAFGSPPRPGVPSKCVGSLCNGCFWGQRVLSSILDLLGAQAEFVTFCAEPSKAATKDHGEEALKLSYEVLWNALWDHERQLINERAFRTCCLPSARTDGQCSPNSVSCTLNAAWLDPGAPWCPRRGAPSPEARIPDGAGRTSEVVSHPGPQNRMFVDQN